MKATKKDSSTHTAKKDSGKVKKPAPAPKRAPEPADEDDADMPPTADDAAADFIDGAVKSTPWWALSLAFHGVVLASLPLIVFSSKLLAAQDPPVVISFRAPDKARIKDPEPAERRGLRETPGDVSATPDDIPNVRFPNAVEGPHFEEDTGDPDPTHQGIIGDPTGTNCVQGQDTGWGRQPGMGKGSNDVTGVGGGSGSGKKFGTGPFGGRRNMFMKGHGRPGTSDTMLHGLLWLARHQSPDGHWSSEGFHAQCEGGACRENNCGLSDFDVGNTGLALLGFLGAGYTPSSRDTWRDPVTKKTVVMGEVVRKGVKWLIEHQNAEGAIGPQVGEMMYNHAIAALALSEAYGLTGAVSYAIPAQKAIAFIVTAQNYGLGWRYTPKCGNNDTSVTGWCVMALKSAQVSGLEVPQTSYVGAKAWLDRVTDSNGQHGYDRLGSGEIYVPGKNEKWQHHPSMTAVGLLCRIFIDKKKGEKVLADSSKILMQDLPKWDPNSARPTVDYYYWYYSTLALFQFHGPDAPEWKTWNKAVSTTLCDHQRTSKDGCKDGSWDTENTDRWAYAGGRVYATAINVLTLETSFRYELVFGSEKRGGK